MANDKSKTKAQLIAELEEMRQQLEKQSEQARRERAVERVRAEVMAMRSSQDLLSVVAVLYREMLNLGLRTYGASIQFVEDNGERIWTYFAFPNPKKDGISWTSSDLVEFDRDIAIHQYELPSNYDEFDDFFQRWQEGNPWSFKTDKLFEKWTTLAQNDLGMDRPPPAPETVAWTVTNVPFAYGTVGFNEPELNQSHVAVIKDLTDALSLGYLRFLDFQKLEEQNQILEENTRRKSDFLARMSHDLRTPMNAIIGYTRILLRRCRDTLESRQLRNLENIDISAHNLLNLINEILDLSRVEAGRIDVHPQPVDLQQLAVECVAAIEPLVGAEVQLVQNIEAVPFLRTDGEILRKVLMNLLGNAVKFTDAGSITVSVQSVGDQVEISVADTGMGIPSEDLPDIFEEFRQVERQGSTEKEGTGLGLAIAKKSVELLGGTLSAESEVGTGATFTLRIKDYPSE